MSSGSYSKHQIDQIRDRTKISSIVGNYVVWDKKKTNVGKGDFWACCPFHGERKPSFHVLDQRGIYHCFGCGVSGDVFRFLTEHTGCTFPEAVAQLGGERELGPVDPAVAAKHARERQERETRLQAEQAKAEENTRARARAIWLETIPLIGTLGEVYFRTRGIEFAFNFPSLRFHPRLRYWDNATSKELGYFPAVVAGVQGPQDEFLGIWRIYLDGAGNKNPFVPAAKLGLGAYTEAGGAVRLGNPSGQGNICEGIETGMGIVGITGGAPVLATLNTSGMVNFKPPADMTSALIWPDGDVDRIRKVDGKERKIESPGHRAGKELQTRLIAVDFPTAIQPTPKTGADYLDVYTRMQNRLAKNGR